MKINGFANLSEYLAICRKNGDLVEMSEWEVVRSARETPQHLDYCFANGKFSEPRNVGFRLRPERVTLIRVFDSSARRLGLWRIIDTQREVQLASGVREDWRELLSVMGYTRFNPRAADLRP